MSDHDHLCSSCRYGDCEDVGCGGACDYAGCDESCGCRLRHPF